MWRKSHQILVYCAFLLVIVIGITITVPSLSQTSGSLEDSEQIDTNQIFGPGDVKTGYESAAYQTQSKDLLDRRGVKQDLLKIVQNPPLGLPELDIPSSNQPTRLKIDLGRKLFFDKRLSINNTVSCAVCHIPEQGFTNNEIRTAVGVEGRFVLRNSPTLYNVAYQKHLFFDGREISLENQVWQPITAHNEMAAPAIGYVINKIKKISEYDGLFEAAFDQRGPDIVTIGNALANYQRSLLSADSPFDRWFYLKQEDAITESAKRGFEIFSGKGTCVVCHQVNENHALFSDHKFHNTGIGYDVSFKLKDQKHKTKKVQLAPGVFIDLPMKNILAVSRVKDINDLGLYRVTQDPNDRWKFRTQSLRNIELTAPYMHNGQFGTIREVIDFYDQGGIPNELLSPFIRPLGLTEQEKLDLEEFLLSLTGSNVPEIVADAFAAEIGELTKDDPNWTHENKLEY